MTRRPPQRANGLFRLKSGTWVAILLIVLAAALASFALRFSNLLQPVTSPTQAAPR